MKSIEDLQLDEDIVQDKPSPSTIIITTPVHMTKAPLKIQGRTRTKSQNKREIIKTKIIKVCEDLQAIKTLQTRRRRYLAEIIPYIESKLYEIYQVDNEPLTYHQLKNEYLKDLFPDDASAIAFKKKHLKH